MKKGHVFALSSFAILSLVSCGSVGYKHTVSKEVRHYSADLNHDGYIKAEDKETNLTWAESYDVLLKQTNDISELNTFADSMGIAKNEPKRENLARYEIMHEAEELLMSTGAIIPLYNYEDPFLLKPNIDHIYASGVGGKMFDKLLKNGQKDQSFNFSIGTCANSLDPAINDDSATATIITNCFSGLTRWEMGEEELAGQPRVYTAETKRNMDLVKEWKEEETDTGAMKYTFKLKNDLKFNKNGYGKSEPNKITAKNFIWSWNRAASVETGTWIHMFESIKGAEEWEAKTEELAKEEKEIDFFNGMSGLTLIDDYTFSVELTNDCPYFYDLLAFPAYVPLDYESITAYESDAKNKGKPWWSNVDTFISNGKLKLTALDNQEGGGATLSRWEDYPGEKATIKEMKLKFIDSDSAMMDGYKSGAFDMIEQIATSLVETWKKNTEEWRVAPLIGLYYHLHNVNDNTFDILPDTTETEREYLRRTFNLLLNRYDYTDSIVRSGATDANGFVSTGINEHVVPGLTLSGQTKEGDNGIWALRRDATTGKIIEGVPTEDQLKTATLVSLDWHYRNKDMSQYWADGTYKEHWLSKRLSHDDDWNPTPAGGFYATVEDVEKTGLTERQVLEQNIKQAFELASKVRGIKITGNSVENYKFQNFPIVTLLTNTGTGHESIAERMQYSLRDFGIDFRIETQEWNAFQGSKKKGAFAIARNGWIADYSDPKTYLTICSSTNANNDSQLGKDSFHYSK